MIKNKTIKLIFIVFSAGLISSCVNLKAIEDFGSATTKFSASYDDVYRGSYDTCLGSAELDDELKKLKSPQQMTTLQEIEANKESCKPYKETGEIYSEVAQALGDYGGALASLASRGNLTGKSSIDFAPQFTEITQNIGEILPELQQLQPQVDKVNQLARILVGLYIKGKISDLIISTESEIIATFELLGVLADLYQTQLKIYSANIQFTDEDFRFKEQNKDETQKRLVSNHIKKYDSRKEILDNYETSLNDIAQSYQELLQRAKLQKPNFDDPIFIEKMIILLQQINDLIQKSNAASGS